MSYTVGYFCIPDKQTDEIFQDEQEAFDRMVERSSELENTVLGIWEDDNCCASYVAINGESFRAFL